MMKSGKGNQRMNKGIIAGGVCLGAAVIMISGMSVAYAQGRGSQQGFSFGFGGNAALSNSTTVPIDHETELVIDYQSQNIHLYPGDEGEIVINEYLWSGRDGAKVTTSEAGGRTRVMVKGDKRPYIMMFGFVSEQIEVFLPPELLKRVEVKTSSGNISSTDIHLSVDQAVFHAGSGNVRTGDITGTVDINTKSGEISIAYIKGDVRAAANSGNVKASGITGDAELTAGSGNIKAGYVKGDLRAGASSGNIVIDEVGGNANVSTNSGEIKLLQLSGAASLSATSGNIRAEFKEFTDEIRAKSSSGNITVDIPAGSSFQFEADTSSGTIKTFFDESLGYNNKGNHAKGQVGVGTEALIYLEAKSGNVKVTSH